MISILDQSPPPAEPASSVRKPLIGLCISICLGVVSVLVGFYAACGPNGGGYNRSATTASTVILYIAFALLGASVLTAVVCVIWLAVAFIRNAGSGN